ncbi:hypothetical protein TSUD_253760 [Trifolium subterraneum]|nr:hypothetical protein TSUD_253760 [Trifolium subterraneum]
MASSMAQKFLVYDAIDNEITQAMKENVEVKPSEILKSVSAYVTTFSLEKHAYIYVYSDDALKRYVREVDLTMPESFGCGGSYELASSLKMASEKISLYDLIDETNEYAAAFQLQPRGNSAFATSIRHHARVYALADHQLRAYLKEKAKLQYLQLMTQRLAEQNYRLTPGQISAERSAQHNERTDLTMPESFGCGGSYELASSLKMASEKISLYDLIYETNEYVAAFQLQREEIRPSPLPFVATLGLHRAWIVCGQNTLPVEKSGRLIKIGRFRSGPSSDGSDLDT